MAKAKMAKGKVTKVQAAIAKMQADVSRTKVTKENQHYQKALLSHLDGLALIHKAFCLAMNEEGSQVFDGLMARLKARR